MIKDGQQGINAAVLFIALVTLYATSIPGGDFGILAPAGLLGLALGLLWLVFLGLTLARREHRADLRRTWLSWAAAPAMAACVAGLVYAGAPVRARFELSRPALERFAASRPAGEDARWVGLFHVEAVERIPGGVRFLVVGSGFLDHHGFVFSPERAPEDDGEGFRYAHLSGPWYTWREGD